MASCREAAKEIIAASLEAYGSQSAAAALDFFDEVMIAEGLRVTGTMPSGIYSLREVDRIARYQSGKLKSDDWDGFITQVSHSVGHLVYQGGNRTMLAQSGLYCDGGRYTFRKGSGRARWAYRGGRAGGGRQIRWARVPQGEETCDFCLMLASRGFVYVSEESAQGYEGHVHRGCDCIVVPGIGHYEDGATNSMGSSWVQDTELAGYDREAMYDLWQTWKGISEGKGSAADKRAAKLAAMQETIGRTEW